MKTVFQFLPTYMSSEIVDYTRLMSERELRQSEIDTK